MNFILTPDELNLFYPANFSINKAGVITDSGPSLESLFLRTIVGENLFDAFDVERPTFISDIEKLIKYNKLIILKSKSKKSLRLRAIILNRESHHHILCSHIPDINVSPDEMLLQSIDFSPLDGSLETYLSASIGKNMLSEAQELAQKFELAKSEAELANSAKTNFLANMSHELRTPLNAIIGFSEMLKDNIIPDEDKEKRTEYAGDIHWSANHLLSLINDILDLSKIEADKEPLYENLISINEFIDPAISIMKPAIKKKKINLSLNTPCTDNYGVRIDARRFKQIMLNLISNSVKFTPEEGKIDIKCLVCEQEGVELIITDTGIGMDNDEINLAMKPFTQIENGLNRQYNGTGLGLPLVNALVKLHGGKFTLKSVKGTGTTAHIWLPPSRIVSINLSNKTLNISA